MKVVVGGQFNKDNIAELIRKHEPQAEIVIKTDLDAAMAIKNNQADYYFGACHTGGGGALAMAIALLGSPKCITVASPGKICSDEEIKTAVAEGKQAFGFTVQTAEQVVPVILNALHHSS